MITNRTFRLFISSTFDDFKKERDILQINVFPNIEKYCRDLGFQFQAVDLRWGITEEAQINQKTMELCINEVKLCKHFPKPNFLIMLGNRYGWIPLPYLIEKNEFEEILNYANDAEKEILLKWYKLDYNHIPASYFLLERTEKYITYNYWQDEENCIRDILQRLIIKACLNQQIKDKYFTSATEQEANYGIFDYKNIEDKKNILAYFKENHNDDNVRLTNFKNSLKSFIPKNNILQNLDDLSFIKNITNKIKNLINEQISLLNTIDEIEKEKLEHRKFKKEKIEIFKGRDKELEILNKYIYSDNTQPFIITGKSGIGKSALIAKAIDEICKTNKNIVYRFIGATEKSTSLRELLISITNQITDNSLINYEIEKNKFFSQILNIWKELKKETIIFLDSIDQLNQELSINWIPIDFQVNFKIIISTLNDDNYPMDSLYFEKLKATIRKKNILTLKPISSILSVNEIILKLLKKSNRTITTEQLNFINKKYNLMRTPLYLKIAIETIKNWKSFDNINSLYLAESVENQIQIFIMDLIKFHHHPKSLVFKTLGYLNVSKNGLSENELINLLSMDQEIKEVVRNNYHKFNQPTIPISYWIRLSYSIKPFIKKIIVDDHILINFFHREFKRNINNSFFPYKDIYNNMIIYFYNLNKYNIKEKNAYDIRALTELPHILYYGQFFEHLDLLFNDLDFINAIYINDKHENFKNILLKYHTSNPEISKLKIYNDFFNRYEYLLIKLSNIKISSSLILQLSSEQSKNSIIFENIYNKKIKNNYKYPWLYRINNYENNDNSEYTVFENNIIKIIKLKNNNFIGLSNNHDIIIWDKYFEEKINLIKNNDTVINILEFKTNYFITMFKENYLLIRDCNGHTIKKITLDKNNYHFIDISNESITDNQFILYLENKIKIYNNFSLTKIIELEYNIIKLIYLERNIIICKTINNEFILLNIISNLIIYKHSKFKQKFFIYKLSNSKFLINTTNKHFFIFEINFDNYNILFKEINIENVIPKNNSIDKSKVRFIGIGCNKFFITGKFIFTKKNNIAQRTIIIVDLEKKINDKLFYTYILNINSSIRFIYELGINYYISQSINNYIQIFDQNKKINLKGHNSEIINIFETYDKKIISYSKDGLIIKWSNNFDLLENKEKLLTKPILITDFLIINKFYILAYRNNLLYLHYDHFKYKQIPFLDYINDIYKISKTEILICSNKSLSIFSIFENTIIERIDFNSIVRIIKFIDHQKIILINASKLLIYNIKLKNYKILIDNIKIKESILINKSIVILSQNNLIFIYNIETETLNNIVNNETIKELSLHKLSEKIFIIKSRNKLLKLNNNQSNEIINLDIRNEIGVSIKTINILSLKNPIINCIKSDLYNNILISLYNKEKRKLEIYFNEMRIFEFSDINSCFLKRINEELFFIIINNCIQIRNLHSINLLYEFYVDGIEIYNIEIKKNYIYLNLDNRLVIYKIQNLRF
ncbi:DUF4062 domain-containing protein [Arcobacter cryaerophilus gv. pseudocryaerophilus]